MGRTPGGMPLLLVAAKSVALAASLSLIVTWTALALGVSSSARAAPDSDNAPRIYHKARNFRIPFNLNASSKDRIKELHLLVSEDSVITGERTARHFQTTPPSRSDHRTTVNTGSRCRRARSMARSRHPSSRRFSQT